VRASSEIVAFLALLAWSATGVLAGLCAFRRAPDRHRPPGVPSGHGACPTVCRPRHVRTRPQAPARRSHSSIIRLSASYLLTTGRGPPAQLAARSGRHVDGAGPAAETSASKPAGGRGLPPPVGAAGSPAHARADPPRRPAPPVGRGPALGAVPKRRIRRARPGVHDVAARRVRSSSSRR
jgi:hypothetical protein